MRRLMMSTSMLGLAVLAAAASPASAAPQYYVSSGGTIRCESNDGRTRECATGGERVVLERQISSSACIEGRSWGYGRTGIWVSQGCRADFRIVGNGYGGGNYGGNYGGNDYGNGQVIRCESNDGRNRTCPMDTRGGVQLVRQISSTACIEGRNWGFNRGGVWVTNGCRADFQSGGGSYGGSYGNNYGSGGEVIRCESSDGRNRTCPMDTRGGVRLVRQISKTACIEGRNWGFNRGGVWVTNGCRADFQSGGGSYGGNYGNNYGNNYGIGGQVFRCESNDGRTRECAANTRAGVQLIRQLSNAACIQGRTWGYGRNGIWVSQGCRAEFRAY